jgi:DNA primase
MPEPDLTSQETSGAENDFSFEKAIPLDQHEKSILYYVIRYGEVDIINTKHEYGHSENSNRETKQEDPVYVIEYIVDELKCDDLKLTHPAYRQILEETFLKYREEGFCAETYFRNHIDPKISKIAADLSTDKYIESKIHSKYKSVQKEEERLKDLVPYVVHNYKNALLQNTIDELNRQLQETEKTNDAAQMVFLLKELSDLTKKKQQFALSLRERIVTKI